VTDPPQTRPTLEVAAQLGVPVLAHPVAPQPLTRSRVPCGRIGTLFARDAANGASPVALIEGEVLSQWFGLRVVATVLARGVAMVAGHSSRSPLPSGAIDVIRKRVFIDSSVVHPSRTRASVDRPGAENVIPGSDCPINVGPIRNMLTMATQDARPSNDEPFAIAAGNCGRLRGVG
jgi:hypothetical protein